MKSRCLAAFALLAAAAAPSAEPVRIQHFLFQQPVLHVAVGDTVTWSNADTVVHTVVADGAAFRSPPLDEDDRFSFTFAQAGVYHYHCSLHPKMQGTVVVGAGS